MKFTKKAKQQADLIIAYKRLFDCEDGEKVLLDLCRAGKIDVPTFAPDNQYETAFREGQRYIVLRILKTINSDPAYVAKLIEAGQSKEQL